MEIIKIPYVILVIIYLSTLSCNNTDLSNDKINNLQNKPIDSIGIVNDFYEFNYKKDLTTIKVANYLESQLFENSKKLKDRSNEIGVGFRITKYNEFLLLYADISSKLNILNNVTTLIRLAEKEIKNNAPFYYLVRSIHEILKIEYLHSDWEFYTDRKSSIESLKRIINEKLNNLDNN